MASLTRGVLAHSQSRQWAERCREQGLRLLERGLLVAAACHFEEWLWAVEPEGDPNQVVSALNALASAEQLRGEHGTALGWLRRAEPYLDSPALDPRQRIRYHLNRFVSLHWLGADGEARQVAEEAVRLAEALGSPDLAAAALLNRSAALAREQDWTGMREAAAEALEHYRRLGDPQGVVASLTNLGIAHLELGELSRARSALEEALALAEGMARVRGAGRFAPPPLGYILTELGRLSHQEGDLDGALRCAARALEALLADVATLDKEEVAKLSELFGRIFADRGEVHLALRYLNRAAAYFSQLGRVPEWQRVVDALQQVLQRRAGRLPPAPQLPVPGLDFLTAVLDMTDELETVDPYIRNHCERVAALAVLLGEALGLTPREIRLLRYAGRLHDLGKVAVDAQILAKPGPLTPREWERIRVHPVVGAEMLRPFGLEEEGLAAIRHHHERWDGTGYPDGLRGEEIPLLARILAVADVYDALTSDRVYRRAHGHWQALAILQEMAGSQLDPHLVRLLIDMHQ